MVTFFHCFNFNEDWYLVEMGLNLPPRAIPFDEIVVPEEGVRRSDWQTVLAEQFLNRDGTARICDLYDIPDTDEPVSRVAFYIYKTDSHILSTPYGQFELSDAEEAPDRLKAILEIDDDYM